MKSKRTKELVRWVARGRQKREVALAFHRSRTLTMSGILHATRETAPCLRLRDIWRLLRTFEAVGLLKCLTPSEPTGKIYGLTELGLRVLVEAFGGSTGPAHLELLPEVPPEIRAKILRAKARRAVFEAIRRGRMEFEPAPMTASIIRKSLLGRYPMGLNQVIRALGELERLGAIEGVVAPKGHGRREYRETLRKNFGEPWADQS